MIYAVRQRGALGVATKLLKRANVQSLPEDVEPLAGWEDTAEGREAAARYMRPEFVVAGDRLVKAGDL